MKTKLINIWGSLKSSFWLIPTLMVIAAIVWSFNMVAFDRYVDPDALAFPVFLYAVSPEGARAILSTIAGSMMTVAGVTFSITIVVLNLASTQFGPRLLRNFMQDRGTQFVLGTFVSSFIYCLLVLRSIQTNSAEIFVPGFSVTLAVILAFLSVGVLIFFIHHVSTSIQADRVIAQVSWEMKRNIERLFPHEREDNSGNLTQMISALQEDNIAHYHHQDITARVNGYLQAIDHDGLLQMANDSDYLINIQLRPGDCVVPGRTMAIVSSEKEFDSADTMTITDAFIVGRQRTPEQDAEYSIHQLVEIALRALSPGINDPYTAIACIDQLGSVLCYLAARRFPPASCFDDKGQLRLKTKPYSFSGMVNAAFDQIRQHGRANIAVTIRLLETLTMISEQSCHHLQRQAIHRQANMILQASRHALLVQEDADDIQERYETLLGRLNGFADEEGPYEVIDFQPASS